MNANSYWVLDKILYFCLEVKIAHSGCKRYTRKLKVETMYFPSNWCENITARTSFHLTPALCKPEMNF